MYSNYSSSESTFGPLLLMYGSVMTLVALLVISIMTPVGIQLLHVFHTFQLAFAQVL